MERPRSVRTIRSFQQRDDKQPYGGEYRLRVHDHDEHQFEPPSPPPETKPEPFVPRKHRYFPIATPVVMVASIVVFILMMYENNCPRHIGPGRACVGKWLKPLSFQPWSENPMLGPERRYLLKWGALESTRYSILSFDFLSISVSHCLINERTLT